LLSIESTRDNGEHELLPLGAIRPRSPCVEAEKNQAGTKGCPLISVYEGMIAAEEEQVSGGDLRQVSVGGFSTPAGLRRRNGRLEQSPVANTWRSTESGDRGRVNLKQDLHREMEAILCGGSHARRRIVRA